MSEEDILTAEESEALLEQSDDSADASVGGVRDPDEDFWEQVATDRIPTLEGINEELSGSLVAAWKRLFRQEIVVSVLPALRRGGREYAKGVAFEESVRAFEIQSRDEHCLLVVRPDTVSAMVDICFGGSGAGARSERLSGLTEMEARVLSRFADAMRDAAGEIWRKRAGIALADAAGGFDATSHPLCEFSARVVVCTFAFDIAGAEHRVDFVWPAALIDTLKKEEPRALPAAEQRPELGWATRIREDIQGATIEVHAVIRGIPIRLHQISEAQIGDVIVTEPLDKVSLLAGGKAVFEGTLGTHKGFNAVKISQPFTRKRSGDA